MIENIVQDRLKAVLTNIPVFLEMPEKTPPEFVYVEKTGSGRLDLLDSAVLLLSSYAQSLFRAAEINEAVKACMDALPQTDCVFSARLNSDFNATDRTLKKYRYEAVYDLYF